MKTEDELIAEFIGATIDRATSGGKKLWNFSNLPEFCKQIDISENRLRVFYADDLRFSISWDWLMPVVEKIESIYKQGKLFQCPQYQRIRGVKITDVTITELHALIVDFIKWYNSQNS